MCNRSDNKICLADIDVINKSLLKIQLWYVHYYLVNTLEYIYSNGEKGACRVQSDVIKFIIELLNNAKTEIKDSTSFLVINFDNDKSKDFHSFIPNTRVKLLKKTAFSVKKNDTQVSEHDNLKNDTSSSSIPHIFPAIVNGLSAFALPAAAGVVISQTHASSTFFTPFCKILDRNKVSFAPPNNPQDLNSFAYYRSTLARPC